AAELEDYDICEAVLAPLLDRAPGDSPADMLVTAALLQQRSLRLWDSGRPQSESPLEAAALLSRIDVRDCPPFPLSPGIAGSHTDTLTRIIEALQRAAWSALP